VRYELRMPKNNKATDISRSGAQMSSRILTAPRQFGGLPQIAQVADELSERHAMGHGTKQFPRRPGFMSDAFAAQVIQQNQKIQVLKMAEHAVDDGTNLSHGRLPSRHLLPYSIRKPCR